MTESLETLTRRVDTLTSIRGIVHTMKTLSTINAVPYEHAAQSIEAYRKVIIDGLHAFLHRHGPLAATLGKTPAHTVISFGSDHGLCGNYNEGVAGEVARLVRCPDRPDDASTVLCVGAQMDDALHELGVHTNDVLFPPANASGLGRLAAQLVTRLDAIGRDSPLSEMVVNLVFTRRSTGGQQAPAVQRLLPMDAELLDELAIRPWASRSLPMFRLPADELLAALIRGYLFAEVFRAAAEALVTENAARLARMQQAEQSVDGRLAILGTETRQARQNEITTELLDVIMGFEALKKRRR